jgi:hypothetical protein
LGGEGGTVVAAGESVGVLGGNETVGVPRMVRCGESVGVSGGREPAGVLGKKETVGVDCANEPVGASGVAGWMKEMVGV